jgi:hypothetical protein
MERSKKRKCHMRLLRAVVRRGVFFWLSYMRP